MSFKTFTQQYFLHAEPKRKGAASQVDSNKAPRRELPMPADIPSAVDVPTPSELEFILLQLTKLTNTAAADNWSSDKSSLLGLMTSTFHTSNIHQLKRMCNTMLKHFPKSDENAAVRASLIKIMQGPPTAASRSPPTTASRSPPASPPASPKLQEGDHVRLHLTEEVREIEERSKRGEGEIRKEIKTLKKKIAKFDTWYIGGGLHKDDVYLSLHQESGKGDGKRTCEWSARKRFVSLEKVELEDLSQEDKTLFDNSVELMKKFGGEGLPFYDTDINLSALNNVKKTATKEYDKIAKQTTTAIMKAAASLTKEYQFEMAIELLNKIEEKTSNIKKQIQKIKDIQRGSQTDQTSDVSPESKQLILKAKQSAVEADGAFDQLVYDSSQNIIVETWAIRAGLDIMRKGTRFEILFDQWYEVKVVTSDPQNLTLIYKYVRPSNNGNTVRFLTPEGLTHVGVIETEQVTTYTINIPSGQTLQIEKSAVIEIVTDVWANTELSFRDDVFRFPDPNSDNSQSDISSESSSSSSSEDEEEDDCCLSIYDEVEMEDPHTGESILGTVMGIDMRNGLHPMVNVRRTDTGEVEWIPMEKLTLCDNQEDVFDEDAAKDEDSEKDRAATIAEKKDNIAMKKGTKHDWKGSPVTIDSDPFLPDGAKKDEDSEHYWVIDAQGDRVSVSASELDVPEESEDTTDSDVDEEEIKAENEEEAMADVEEEEDEIEDETLADVEEESDSELLGEDSEQELEHDSDSDQETLAPISDASLAEFSDGDENEPFEDTDEEDLESDE